MMRCEEAQSRLLDAPYASEVVSGALQEHLQGCGECASFHEALQRLDRSFDARFAPVALPESLYLAVRKKALHRPPARGLLGAAEAINWIGALAVASALGIYVGVDFGAPSLAGWGTLAAFLTLAAYPSWLLSLRGEAR